MKTAIKWLRKLIGYVAPTEKSKGAWRAILYICIAAAVVLLLANAYKRTKVDGKRADVEKVRVVENNETLRKALDTPDTVNTTKKNTITKTRTARKIVRFNEAAMMELYRLEDENVRLQDEADAAAQGKLLTPEQRARLVRARASTVQQGANTASIQKAVAVPTDERIALEIIYELEDQLQASQDEIDRRSTMPAVQVPVAPASAVPCEKPPLLDRIKTQVMAAAAGACLALIAVTVL